MPDKPSVFLTRRLPPETMQRLQADTLLLHEDLDSEVSRSELIEGVRQADGLICLLTDRIDDDVLAAGERLKVVSNYAVGFNNIDVEAATRRGIAVTNTPGVLTECTADMAWALLMAAARRVIEGDKLVRGGNWHGWEPLQLLGHEVSGATIGIVGFGRIGQAMAKRAKAFDMTVLYWNRTRLDRDVEQSLGVEYMPLDELVSNCDFISIHVALCDETTHLIGAEQLKQMKSNAIVINTARGPVIEERALAEALAERTIAAAGLDVYEREPEVHEALLGLPNVVLAPHLGSATIQTRNEMGRLAVENCLAACRGERPENLVVSDQ